MKILLEEIESRNKTIEEFINSLYKIPINDIIKLTEPKYKSETFSDIDLPLRNYMSIEEYVDGFVDWIYFISENPPRELDRDHITLKSLFVLYLKSNEYQSNINEVFDDPSVKEDIEKLSKKEEENLNVSRE